MSAVAGPAAADRIDPRRLLTFVCMVFGMFMSILDIQIVSASLAEIQAGLSASADEISWVQTAYLIAEVVMIPLSGFLGRAFSTRWLFAASAAGFTIMSFICGLCTSIEQMIVARALQGFIGGAMIPSVFAASFTLFPVSKRPVIQPVIGLVATLAPTIGPTLGGYLTDALSWHWLFFINIIPGIGVTIAAITLIDFDEPDLKLLREFDWTGLISMALFLCCLEYVLEEGPRNDWFEDRAILAGAVASGLGALAFFARALTARSPIVDLGAFRNRNFAFGSVFSFVLGIGLYGLTYLYPVFLSRVRAHNSLQIGEILFVTGVVMIIMSPVAGKLSAVLDPRVMLAIGVATFASGSYLATFITRDWDFHELIWPQVLRGAGLILCMVPINNVALGTLSQAELKNGSGLFNLMRNLGGAVGLALINTVLNDRIDLHLARARDHVVPTNPAAADWMVSLTQGFAPLGSDAGRSALARLAAVVRQQATVLAFADVMLLLTGVFLAMLPLVLLLRRPRPAGAGGGGH